LNYRSEIDGLRALAVVPVILFHAGFSLFAGGFVGVDIFFVISGYLITSIIIKEIQVGNFSISNFYERRARRILPALFFITFCTIPFAWLFLPPQYMEEYALSIIGVIFFISNFFFWRSSGYFSSESELQPLLHTWSLAVEEQFYILFPLFLMFAWKFGKKIVLAILMLIFIFSIFLADIASIYQPAFNFFLLPTRAWELLIGAFAAFYLYYSKSYGLPKYLNEILSFLGLSLIVYSIIFFDYMTPFPGRYALVPTLGTAMIILFSQSTYFFKSLLSGKFIVGIGLISYSAYLLHQPMLAFARHSQINELSEFFLIIICLMVFPIAYLIWKYIETPFRKADRVQLNKILYLALLSTVLLFTFGLLGKLSSGYIERLSLYQTQLLNSIDSSPKRTECHTGGSNFLPPMKACQYPKQDGTWAVFGDSHGVELAYELSKKLDLYGDGLTHLTFSGCEPSYEINDPTSFCDEWTDQAITMLIENKNIQNIVIKYAYNSHLFHDFSKEYPDHNEDSCESYKEDVFGSCKNYHDHSWKKFLDLINVLVEKKDNIYLVLQTPELPADIKRLIFNKNFDHHNNVIGFTKSFVEKRSSFVKNRLNDLPSEVSVIDLTNFYCNKKICFGSKNNKSLYFDNGHPSLFAAAIISSEIVRKHYKISNEF